MPLLRERRRIAPKKEILNIHETSRWTLQEKKKLLIALRKLHPNNTEQIQSDYLPHRTEKEISWFIERMKSKVYRKPDISRPRVPIELWEKLAEELTCHDTDHSYALSEVFRKIAEEEEHFPKNLPENPDWKMIYLYFSALLNGDEPPEVGQIEAAVLLDLTEALAKQLKMLDLTEQQLVMIRKYNCLAERINAKSSEEYLELTKKGLDEDPSNSADQSNKPAASSESTPSGSQTEQGNKAPIVIEPLASTSQAPASAKKFVVGERFSGLHSRTQKRGRKKKTPSAPLPLSSLQKTALYSINPFCIPIRYLNPKVKPPPSPEIPSNAASNEGSSEAAQT